MKARRSLVDRVIDIAADEVLFLAVVALGFLVVGSALIVLVIVVGVLMWSFPWSFLMLPPAALLVSGWLSERESRRFEDE